MPHFSESGDRERLLPGIELQTGVVAASGPDPVPAEISGRFFIETADRGTILFGSMPKQRCRREQDRQDHFWRIHSANLT